ncbi:flavodoxin family protein [Nocardioides scoriae]|nr:NAD(P)H-dependent oxidoreductase [Nocardioides scoriae]
MTTIRALVLSCSLKKSPAPSSSELLGTQVLDALRTEASASGAGIEVSGEVLRVVDHPVAFGVSTDEGGGDGWPTIRAKLLEADVLVLATPIWMGQPASVCKMVLERLDAELSETDDAGRTTTLGKVAVVAVVGNEDGAHHTTAEVLQGLNDVGFSIAANASTYWVGEAMQGVDYNDHEHTPDATAGTTTVAARNALHLIGLLHQHGYPGQS